MRLPLTRLEIFVAIQRHGSLRAAADALGLQASTVSHQLKALEQEIGAPLFIRTTRSVTLTDAGRVLSAGAAPAFGQLGSVVDAARTTGRTPRGRVKLALPDFVYDLLLAQSLPSFMASYPEIELELSLTDAFSDIVSDGFHAGFRLGDRIAEDMIAVRLGGPLKLAVFGSPDYLERRGRPETPSDLLDHACIRYRFQTSGRLYPWTFMTPEGDTTVDLADAIIVNTLPAAIDLAERGVGLAYTFRDLVAEKLSTGALASVLDAATLTVPGIYIYFPTEYRTMVPLKVLVNHLRA